MENPTAKIYVTKLAAAHRQLRAAMRMFFVEGDELAIHTVASAAYRILNDLKLHRGKSEATDILGTGIYYMTIDYLRGDISEKEIKDMGLQSTVNNLIKNDVVTINTKLDEFDLKVSVTFDKEYWRWRNQVSNFLKHADRDLGGKIDLDSVDNESVIGAAMAAYLDLTDGKFDESKPEFVTWMIYINSTREIGKFSWPENYRGIIEKVSGLEDGEKIKACDVILRSIRDDPELSGNDDLYS